MSWSENLFGNGYDAVRRWLTPRVDAALAARRVDVTAHVPRFDALARLLTSAHVRVTLVDGDAAGGWSGDTIWLPRQCALGPTNAANFDLQLARLVWSCASRTLGFVLPLGHSLETALVATALAAPAIRRFVASETPQLRLPPNLAQHLRPLPTAQDARQQALAVLLRLASEADSALPPGVDKNAIAWADAVLALAPMNGAHLARALDTVPALPAAGRRVRPSELARLTAAWPWGVLLPATRMTGARGAPRDDATQDLGATGATERQKPLQRQLERLEEPADQLAENPLVHSFEKVHTLDTYRGGSKRIDGDDELAAHQKALDELDLRQVVRSHRAVRSLYRADVADQLGMAAPPDEEPPSDIAYDEWNSSHQRWLPKWCNLKPQAVALAPDADALLHTLRAQLVRTTQELRSIFERFEAARAWQLRQRSGPDVDIDAVVDYRSALRAGHAGDPKLYAARRRHTRDTAVFVLLDSSLSTDGWVAGRRVIDVEKAAVIALGDALDGLFDDVAVAGFCSQTRRDCRFLLAKDFGDTWAVGARRVASLQPAGYTRIGPALRHASVLLQASAARRKLLLLVSDGKPSDADRYEGRYGMNDVRRAVTDAQRDGVHIHAIAVDPSAQRWLPTMFGHGRATVVQQPNQLVNALTHITAAVLRA